MDIFHMFIGGLYFYFMDYVHTFFHWPFRTTICFLGLQLMYDNDVHFLVYKWMYLET